MSEPYVYTVHIYIYIYAKNTCSKIHSWKPNYSSLPLAFGYLLFNNFVNINTKELYRNNKIMTHLKCGMGKDINFSFFMCFCFWEYFYIYLRCHYIIFIWIGMLLFATTRFVVKSSILFLLSILPVT